MPGEEIKEIAGSILWLKWGITLIASCVGISATATGALVAYTIKAVKKARDEMREKLDDMHEMMGRDMTRIADKVNEVDSVTREIEKNFVRQDETIKGIIKICGERHNK